MQVIAVSFFFYLARTQSISENASFRGFATQNSAKIVWFVELFVGFE